jgi:hypothetical protein
MVDGGWPRDIIKTETWDLCKDKGKLKQSETGLLFSDLRYLITNVGLCLQY